MERYRCDRMEAVQDSIWFRTISAEQRALLAASDPLPETAEVVVVGAGLIGLATAYYLRRAGIRDICIVDRCGPSSEASGANAGGLWFGQQSPELGPVARLAEASSRLYKELAERFEIDFRRPGMLELCFDEAEAATLDERCKGIRASGLGAEKLSGKQARSLEPALAIEPIAAAFYPDEGKLHPVKLACSLLGELRANGVRVCSGVEAERLGDSVETNQGAIRAGTTVIAAGAWTPLLTRTIGWEPPIRPIRGTLLALPASPDAGLLHTVMSGKYYYWQLASGQIAGGGSEDDVGFEHGVEEATVADIRAEMARHFPAFAKQETLCAWSGFRPYCEGLRPVIGAVPGRERTFVAAGHFKKGVMMAPVSGKILADLIVSGETDLEIEALRPDRFGGNTNAA